MTIRIKDYGRTPEAIEKVAEEKMTSDEMQEKYSVEGFMAPYVTVIRKSDSVRGTLEFGHSPRVYFNFRES